MNRTSASITRVLSAWVAVGSLVVVLLLSYLAYLNQVSQFHQTWAARISRDLEVLGNLLQEPLSTDDLAMADQSVTRMGVQPQIAELSLVTDGIVRSSTNRALVGMAHAGPNPQAPPDTRGYVFHMDDTHAFAALPLTYRGAALRERKQAWLHAEYDIADDLQQLHLAMAQRAMLALGVVVVFLLLMARMARDKLISPLREMMGFARQLAAGEYGRQLQLHALDEFNQLEAAFNELSNSLLGASTRLREQAVRDRAFAEAFPDTAFLVGRDGITRSRYGSEGGSVPGPTIGSLFNHWLAPAEADNQRKALESVLDTGRMAITTFQHHAFHLESRMAPLMRDGTEDGNNVEGVLWLIRDTSDIKHHQDVIEHQANFDPLTDLANRRLVLQHVTDRLAALSANGGYGTLLFIDLDDFANINDSLGHPVGDGLLVELAHRLVGQFGTTGIVARLGGDEFVLIPEQTFTTPESAATQALQLGDGLVDLIRQPLEAAGHRFVLTASVGVAVYPSDGADAHDVLRQADTAMYHAKGAGRGTCRVYVDSMLEENRRKLRLYSDLREAIAKGDFHLVFQPQIDAEGTVCGAEALVRWVREGKPIPPDVFIKAAEETDQIVALGNWILREGLSSLRHWKASGILPAGFGKLAINVSARQFIDGGFESVLDEATTSAGISPSEVEIELTESVFVEDKDVVREKMARLNGRGYTFALDDFGTGYSSLSYLQHLPIAKLKIDRSFVTDIEAVEGATRIVDSIIQLGGSLGVAVIAEGVETDNQRRYLEARGCRLYQGYFFSRPLAGDSFEAFVAARQPTSPA